MKNFIEELYYGNIGPQNSGFEDDESVPRTLRTISDNEDYFLYVFFAIFQVRMIVNFMIAPL